MRALLVVALAFALSGCVGEFLTGELDPAPAPEFSLTDTDGRQWNLTDLEGRVVLIDFMGTWCTPCQRAVPVLQDMQDAYPELVVLSVSSTDTEAKVQDFRHQHGADWPHIVDDGSTVQAFLEAGAPQSTMMWPSYAIIDQDGQLRFYNRGETLPATFTAALDDITVREGPAVRADAWGLGLFAFALGLTAWASPYLLRHTVGMERPRPPASPLVGFAVYAALGMMAVWYSRPLSGRVATVAPFLVVAAALAIVLWRVRGTERVQAEGKHIDHERPWHHTLGFWGNTLWYLLPVWGAVLHGAMLRTSPAETLLLPVALAVGIAVAEALGALPRVRERLQALGERAGWIGAAPLIAAALWNGFLYLR